MKKIILGMVAAFALVTFAAPAVRAEEAAAGDAKPAPKKEKKAKKGKKAEGDAPAAGDDAKK